MKLKRNLLTILYTVLFLLVIGLGLFQMLNLIVSTVPNKYLISGIIILGLIIYLIIAFFIKETDALHFIQTNRALLILLECVVVLLCCGLFFYIRWVDMGMASALIYTLLLFSIYVTARLCGGRMTGILCIIASFYMFSSLINTELISTQSAIDMLCFLLPFCVFIGIQKILISQIVSGGFILVLSYLVLGFVFSLALSLNPFVCILLIGCVFSLFFTSTEHGGQGIWTKGIFSAALLVLFTIGFVICVRFITPDLLGMPSLKLDQNLPLEFSFDTLIYTLNKYARPLTYMHLHFSFGIFPTLLLFFSFLAGYYTIRNKSSYMGPLILSQTALFVYYIGFCEGGSQFHYLYYMLPIFASYGFSNTLICVDPATQEEADSDPDDTTTIETEPASIPEPEAPTPATDELLIPEPVSAEAEVPVSEDVPVSEEIPVSEEVPISKEVPITEEVPSWEEPSDTPKKQKKEKKQKQKKEKPQKKQPSVAAIFSTVQKEDIPDWTIPPEFLPENQDLEPIPLNNINEQEETTEELQEELPETDTETIMEPEVQNEVKVETEVEIESEDLLTPSMDDSIDLDQFVKEEPSSVPDMVTASAPEIEASDDIVASSVGSEDLSSDNVIQMEESDQIEANAVEHNESNDIEQFVSAGTSEKEETQLNNLLERLDMSEPIKRMNESAQEDIADVIEREEEQVELSEALPLRPSKSALPKYKKPDFDLKMEPLNIPLDDQFSTISEYDEVPTVHDLENQWKNNSKPVIETVATNIEEMPVEKPDSVVNQKEEPETVHSEQIVRKNGMGKRSYHKITIR